LNTVKRSNFKAIEQVCAEHGVRLVANHKANTGVYGKEKALIYGEVLGGFILIPFSVGHRIKHLNEVLDTPSGSGLEKFLPQQMEPPRNNKLIVLSELLVLERTPKCCNQLVDWARGEPCQVILAEDTPPELVYGMRATGDNFTFLPHTVDKSEHLRNAKSILCSTDSGMALEALWYHKELSFMKEGKPHDIGPFRLINVLLANKASVRRKRLVNFLNAKSGGFFLPGKDGLTELRTFLISYEDNHEKFTNAHRA